MEKMYLVTAKGIQSGQPIIPGDKRKIIPVDNYSLFFRSKKQKPETVFAELTSYLRDHLKVEAN